MIRLLVPALIGGRMFPAGTVTAAPETLEKRLVSAGNAEQVRAVERSLGLEPRSGENGVPQGRVSEAALSSGGAEASGGKTFAVSDVKLGRAGVQAK